LSDEDPTLTTGMTQTVIGLSINLNGAEDKLGSDSGDPQLRTRISCPVALQ